MKRIALKVLARDEVRRERIHFDGLLEIESYEEKDIPRDKSVLEEHSFDELFEGLTEIANAVWDFAKGLFKLSKWTIILIIEGLRYLWKHGAGSKDNKDKDKKEAKPWQNKKSKTN